MGMGGHDATTFDTTVDDRFVNEELVPRAVTVYPPLADAGIHSRWAGLYEMTPDRLPVVGPAPVDGLWIAAGFSGHGFQHGPIVGKVVAEIDHGSSGVRRCLGPFLEPVRGRRPHERAPCRVSAGSGGRTRTGRSPRDFESRASASSAIPACATAYKARERRTCVARAGAPAYSPALSGEDASASLGRRTRMLKFRFHLAAAGRDLRAGRCRLFQQFVDERGERYRFRVDGGGCLRIRRHERHRRAGRRSARPARSGSRPIRSTSRSPGTTSRTTSGRASTSTSRTRSPTRLGVTAELQHQDWARSSRPVRGTTGGT